MTMLVKTQERNGHWRMWEAQSDLSFLGHHIVINHEVGEGPITTEEEVDRFLDGDDSFEWAQNFWADDRFPTNGVDELVYLTPGDLLTEGATGQPTRYFRNLRWVKFHDGHVLRMVITDGPVFILNSSGDTIESIRN